MATTPTWSTDMLPKAESLKGNNSSCNNKSSSMVLHYQVDKETMGDITITTHKGYSSHSTAGCLASSPKGYSSHSTAGCLAS